MPSVLKAASTASISIIIDDIGDRLEWGRRAVELPAPIACAFLPHTPYAERLAKLAHTQGKEVLLHLPMQAVGHNALGPGAITLDMTRLQFVHTVRKNLASIPHVMGINNHMGSLITRHPGHRGWLMAEMRGRGGLFFVDSRTTKQTVALQLAREFKIPSTQRDVFLDDSRDAVKIQQQINRLIKLARRNGYALGIGHPYPETMRLLEKMIASMAHQGIQLIPVTELISKQVHDDPGSSPLWQVSLSRSRKAAKN